ncbi:hypothetical protein TGRUB_272450 [Toxoplasma gondii RUB]|uniref:Uncharacterized protein n=1 Tax=Toxoplasma gondii RUB TaxID=935652 RepID=A0A086M5E6_TOXGO|nr:hypothetical protein TGRUB_272450 [Toxoplasma gondii RUB]
MWVNLGETDLKQWGLFASVAGQATVSRKVVLCFCSAVPYNCHKWMGPSRLCCSMRLPYLWIATTKSTWHCSASPFPPPSYGTGTFKLASTLTVCRLAIICRAVAKSLWHHIGDSSKVQHGAPLHFRC